MYRFIFLLALAALHAGLLGQEPLQVARVSGIVLDGHVDEPAWEAIPPLPMVQYEPNAGASPTERTEIRIGYDEDYFYVSLKGYDRDPDGIRATSLYRDRISGSDHLEVMLDTYNDNQSGFIFTTTPAGIRNDLAIYNDATGGTISSSSWANRDFNTFWDAETTVTPEGWFAEIRIPFSSLRFQDTDGRVVMGFTAQRKIARRRERLVYPAIGPITNFAFLRPSLAQKIVFEGIRPSHKLYVTPYVLGGHERVQELNAAGTGYTPAEDFKRNAGADVKLSLTNNLTADFTVNTDFAQAEADDQQVNLTRFSLFFPEKRQFFLERASIFDFRTGGLSRLFFSRRIGLTGDGRQVPIWGGMRLTGRMQSWDVGVLNMQTQALDSLPSENFGALRLRKRVLNQHSYIGGMFTSRLDGQGHANLAYGLDGLIRVVGDDYLTLQWAQTFDNRDPIDVGGLENGRLAVELNRRRRKGFGYTLGAIYSGAGYAPGIGFVDRRDFKYGAVEVSHTWLREKGPFIWHQGKLLGNAYLANTGGEVLSSQTGAAWTFSTRGLDSGELSLVQAFERLPAEFPLAQGGVIPVGTYDFQRAKAAYTMAVDKKLRTGVSLDMGSFYDGRLLTLGVTPSWYQSKYLQFNLEYSYNHGYFPARDQRLDFHLARLRVGTALNREISTNAFMQYNGAGDLLTFNVRFRWNFREGQDLWVVFNSGRNTDRWAIQPRLPAWQSRSFLVKYTHTFIF
ncbi:DUF5916 domain-containing protein [Robiginitalea sp. M366]|uniref:carbohydrate binding family 9 domain-containing protein n=1 Tax=Robiginitalea aestuariiviva TaxID=3036903 RepID=UPI00240DD650|nr:DUF5916 domain-containing protein [Robiginitalea aestuariiviva]MDG1572908.1 DUF5916 domain-containing protein [Robiginitalea aestuariiviva]